VAKAKRQEIETADPRRQWREALRAANVQRPPAGAVEAFKRATEECEAAKVAPWRDIQSPLASACDVALMKAGDILTDAILEVWRKQARELRDELGFNAAPALERGLIEHVVLCWSRLALMEIRYSAVMAASNTLKNVEHTERRLTEAQKRYARACAALAKVRKLSALIPKIQVNVAAKGGQQVNVA
jgi:hypothetical protein